MICAVYPLPTCPGPGRGGGDADSEQSADDGRWELCSKIEECGGAGGQGFDAQPFEADGEIAGAQMVAGFDAGEEPVAVDAADGGVSSRMFGLDRLVDCLGRKIRFDARHDLGQYRTGLGHQAEQPAVGLGHGAGGTIRARLGRNDPTDPLPAGSAPPTTFNGLAHHHVREVTGHGRVDRCLLA